MLSEQELADIEQELRTTEVFKHRVGERVYYVEAMTARKLLDEVRRLHSRLPYEALKDAVEQFERE